MIRPIAIAHLAVAALLATLLSTSGAALAQVPGSAPGMQIERLPVQPPSTVVAPNTVPNASQQLDIQTDRNQLELRQRSDEALGGAGVRDQLETGAQLNQLNTMPGR